MKAIPKSADSLFPFSFVYKGSKEPQNELPTHIHDFHEIIYVHKGRGTIFINHTIYEMNAGDVFIVPNDTIHHAVPNPNDLVTSSVIFFSPALIQTVPIEEDFSYLFIVEMIKKNKFYKLPLSKEEKITLERFIDQIETELKGKQFGYTHAAILITHQLLLFLSRAGVEKFDKTIMEEDINRYWMNEIFSFIDKNIQRKISLKLLAEKAHVSPAHFSRVFKDVTGMGVTVYVNKKRANKAKELLHKTNYPISYIAELSGYDSTPHFYRMFKKLVGTTPAMYRNNKRKKN